MKKLIITSAVALLFGMGIAKAQIVDDNGNGSYGHLRVENTLDGGTGWAAGYIGSGLDYNKFDDEYETTMGTSSSSYKSLSMMRFKGGDISFYGANIFTGSWPSGASNGHFTQGFLDDNYLRMVMRYDGVVGIGHDLDNIPKAWQAPYKLYVAGGIRTEAVKVDLKTNWADYVFNTSYKLKPLSEVECFINENKHLPNVPSAEEVESDGLDVTQMLTLQMEKIEELTLYTIQQQKMIDKLQSEIFELK